MTSTGRKVSSPHACRMRLAVYTWPAKSRDCVAYSDRYRGVAASSHTKPSAILKLVQYVFGGVLFDSETSNIGAVLAFSCRRRFLFLLSASFIRWRRTLLLLLELLVVRAYSLLLGGIALNLSSENSPTFRGCEAVNSQLKYGPGRPK